MRRLVFRPERCLGCRSCELRCAVVHSASGAFETALAETPRPRRRVTVVAGLRGTEARRCEQCDEPVCVLACKSGALARATDGTVRLDADRCVGCRMCLMVCPFGVRLDGTGERIVRCDVCEGRALPACVEGCPTRALAVSDETAKRRTTEFRGRVVVVGSSAAGVAACEAAREHAPRCSVTLVTADREDYSRPLLPYALGGSIRRAGLGWRAAGHLEKVLGVEVLRGARASGVRSSRLVLADGREVAYDALVVATGARAARLGVPGADLQGVFVLRDLEDLEEMERCCAPGRRAVVLGSGNVGMQTAEALATRGMGVTVVCSSAHVMSQMVDAEVGKRLGRLLVEHGVGLRTHRSAAKILGEKRATGVQLDDGEVLPADLVVVGKGIVPNVEWLHGSGVATGQGIVVDVCGRTNMPGILAAGDCAEVTDPLTGQRAVSGIWPIASEMGRVAGAVAVGVERKARGALRMNAARPFGVSVISVGEVRPERLGGATARVLVDSDVSYRKLVWREDRLVGALLFGDVSDAGVFYRLYRDAVNIGAGAREAIDHGGAQRVVGSLVECTG